MNKNIPELLALKKKKNCHTTVLSFIHSLPSTSAQARCLRLWLKIDHSLGHGVHPFMLLFQTVSEYIRMDKPFTYMLYIEFGGKKVGLKDLFISPDETCRHAFTEQIRYKAHQNNQYELKQAALRHCTLKKYFGRETGNHISYKFSREKAQVGIRLPPYCLIVLEIEAIFTHTKEFLRLKDDS